MLKKRDIDSSLIIVVMVALVAILVLVSNSSGNFVSSTIGVKSKILKKLPSTSLDDDGDHDCSCGPVCPPGYYSSGIHDCSYDGDRCLGSVYCLNNTPVQYGWQTVTTGWCTDPCDHSSNDPPLTVECKPGWVWCWTSINCGECVLESDGCFPP